MVSNPRSASKRKSTVCGINGPPSLSLAGSARHLPFIYSTACRALAPPAFFRGPERFASLTPEKICHSIFSGPQSSFKILEKVVSERWQASRFVNAWRGNGSPVSYYNFVQRDAGGAYSFAAHRAPDQRLCSKFS